MSNTIGSSSQWLHRPDPSQLASKLFSKLDSKNQGYLEKTDLQSALQSVTGSSNSNVDDLFAKLDNNSDGKVTEDEMSTTLSKLAEQLDSQFHRMRAQDGMQGMDGSGQMPPPPPPSGGQNDAGFSKDELTRQLQEIGDSDSQRSSLINKIVQNFEAADTDGDGKVSFKEAMAYDQKSSTSSTSTGDTTTAAATTSTSSTSTDSVNAEIKLMKQIMQLIHAYSASDATQQTATSSLISTAA